MGNKVVWNKWDNSETFKELDDTQRASLFNHWFHCGMIEVIKDHDDNWVEGRNPSWEEGVTYRAKRSPRESFVHTATKCRSKEGSLTEDQMAIAAYQLFDAGFQEPGEIK